MNVRTCGRRKTTGEVVCIEKQHGINSDCMAARALRSRSNSFFLILLLRLFIKLDDYMTIEAQALVRLFALLLIRPIVAAMACRVRINRSGAQYGGSRERCLSEALANPSQESE